MYYLYHHGIPVKPILQKDQVYCSDCKNPESCFKLGNPSESTLETKSGLMVANAIKHTNHHIDYGLDW